MRGDFYQESVHFLLFNHCHLCHYEAMFKFALTLSLLLAVLSNAQADTKPVGYKYVWQQKGHVNITAGNKISAAITNNTANTHLTTNGFYLWCNYYYTSYVYAVYATTGSHTIVGTLGCNNGVSYEEDLHYTYYTFTTCANYFKSLSVTKYSDGIFVGFSY